MTKFYRVTAIVEKEVTIIVPAESESEACLNAKHNFFKHSGDWSGHRISHLNASLDYEIEYGIGQFVNHPKFGDGVVMALEGKGQCARVQVNFTDSGLKWLVAHYAKLKPAID